VRAPLVAVLVCVASSLCYAASAVRQEQLARTADAGPLALSRRLTWWWTVLATGFGAGLHVLALRYGPLTLVQPLGALTLVFAVPAAAMLAGRRLVAGEVRGVVATVAGLVGLLLLVNATGATRALDNASALAVGALGVAVIGLLVRCGAVGGRNRRSLSYASAAGIASGLASALTQTVTVLAGTDGWLALVGPAAALVALFAPAGLVLAQAAYRYGLGAPLALVIIANPVAAGAVGIARLGERFTAGLPGIGMVAGCAVVLGYGVTVLARYAPGDREPARPTLH
jgi:hypothetical protein